MKLLIDYREHDLINELDIQKKNNSNFSTIEYEIRNLDIGDILIENEDKTYIIIERKTISDLASSIQDGRYTEQSARLFSCNLHHHQIYYLIEGNIVNYNSKFSKINNYTLLSSIISLTHSKGFSIYKSTGITESAMWILQMIHKLSKKDTIPYYNNKETQKENEYVDCIKIKKKDNITKENISIIMLSQIPQVSIQTSKIIFERYKNIDTLIHSLKEDPRCLDCIQTEKKRKINKTTINNILEYLIN